ncbi:MAG: hypothetical protein APR54_04505 [Candidatus Cloacimonas sp. SDB]|nr:MAG: hypothetical protein APR54_04505 [Candidatus Cloacimonas sp. SDB]
MKKTYSFILFTFICTLSWAGTLFVGLEGSTLSTYSSDLSGFPDVTWNAHFNFDVSGAAATPEGMLYLCEGAFNTHLYSATLTGYPQQICTVSEDMSSLAYGRNTLYGYSNYAYPKGIYSIDPSTGNATLVLDVHTDYGFRFFALDYNPVDDLFYGYTEYGTSGLYSINIDTGEMIQLAGTIPADNGQGRGMAVGNNTVYLTATRGDDGISYYAYDLEQGTGGDWVPFTNPYPQYHSTGGAAWIPDPDETIELHGQVVSSDQPETGLQNCNVTLIGSEIYEEVTDVDGNFIFPEVMHNETYVLEIYHEGYDLYTIVLEVEEADIDLGVVVLAETAYPPANVVATVNCFNTEVALNWDFPAENVRELEFFNIFRFQQDNMGNPYLWEELANGIETTSYNDTTWIDLVPDIYQYAVIAEYTNNISSEAAFSNPVEKIPVATDESLLISASQVIAYPNPFNPATTIFYKINREAAADVKISIYNLSGQKVKGLTTIPQYNQRNKTGSIVWDGTGENGQSVTSGIYFVIVRSEGKILASHKCLLLK